MRFFIRLQEWLDTMDEPKKTYMGTLIGLLGPITAIVWLPLVFIDEILNRRK